jgi:succinate dehydrogenase / fumarate reductase cytochrome b subunit
MSITGIFLILFLMFHATMNMAAVFSEHAYDAICAFLGSNWYAVVGSLVLAAGFVIHIIYATWLTLQNRKARGNDRYAVSSRPKTVEWASKNMFVLGLIIVLFILLHLSQYWYHMMFAELSGHAGGTLMGANGQLIDPKDGAKFIQYYFSNPVWVVLYFIWYVAIWFHLTHGFWSAIQTIGWNNKIWISRWRVIAYVVATLLMACFAFVTLFFYVKSLSI